jgi:sarcosine oxidase subunit delta
MSFLLTCPNCGTRRVDEFRFGGEIRPKPEGEVGPHAWGAYLYERANVAGEQHEWWYHRQGCKRWFTAIRHTVTNTVLTTDWFSAPEGALHAQEQDSPATASAGEANTLP